MLRLEPLLARLVDDVLRAIRNARLDDLRDESVPEEPRKPTRQHVPRPGRARRAKEEPTPMRKPTPKPRLTREKPQRRSTQAKPPSAPKAARKSRPMPNAKAKAKANLQSKPKGEPRSGHLGEITDPERLLAGPAAAPLEAQTVRETATTESAKGLVLEADAGMRVGDARPGVIRRAKRPKAP